MAVDHVEAKYRKLGVSLGTKVIRTVGYGDEVLLRTKKDGRSGDAYLLWGCYEGVDVVEKYRQKKGINGQMSERDFIETVRGSMINSDPDTRGRRRWRWDAKRYFAEEAQASHRELEADLQSLLEDMVVIRR